MIPWELIDVMVYVRTKETYPQSLSQQSKTRTNVADPGNASGATFQYSLIINEPNILF